MSNLITSSTIVPTYEATGYSGDNVKTFSTSSWKGSNASGLGITWASSQAITLLTLHRIQIITNVTITGKLASATVFTGVFTSANLSGIEEYSLYTGFSGTIDELVISFTGTGSPEIGYIFCGTSQSIDTESLQFSDNSTDVVSISQGNYAEYSHRHTFQSVQVTLAKGTWSTITGFMRNILTTGYGMPRPYVFDYSDCFTDICFLGVLDSEKVQYDIFPTEPTRKVNCTIGVTEIFGGA